MYFRKLEINFTLYKFRWDPKYKFFGLLLYSRYYWLLIIIPSLHERVRRYGAMARPTWRSPFHALQS